MSRHCAKPRIAKLQMAFASALFALASCTSLTPDGPVWMFGGLMPQESAVLSSGGYQTPPILGDRVAYWIDPKVALELAIEIDGAKVTPSCVAYADGFNGLRDVTADSQSARYFFLHSVLAEGLVEEADEPLRMRIADAVYQALLVRDRAQFGASERKLVTSEGKPFCVAMGWGLNSRSPMPHALGFLDTKAEDQIRIIASFPSMRWSTELWSRSTRIAGDYSESALKRYWFVGREGVDSVSLGEPSRNHVGQGAFVKVSPCCMEAAVVVSRERPFTRVTSRPIWWWQFAMKGRTTWITGSEWVAVSKRPVLVGYHDTIVERGTRREDGAVRLSADRGGWVATNCKVELSNKVIRVTQSGETGWKCIEACRESMLENGRREVEKFAETHMAPEERADLVRQDVGAWMERGTEALWIDVEVGGTAGVEVIQVPVWELDVTPESLQRRLVAMLYEPKAQRLESLLEARPVKFRCVDAKSLLPLAATLNLAEGKLRKQGVAEVVSEGEGQLRSDQGKAAWRDSIAGWVDRARGQWRVEAAANESGHCMLLTPSPQSDDELVVRVAGRKAMTTKGWSGAIMLPESMRYLADDSVDYVLLLGEDGQCVVHRHP